MQKYFMLFVSICFTASIISMEKEFNSNDNSKKLSELKQINSQDKCMICQEEAGELDLNKIFIAKCCNQFICHDCYVNLIGRQNEKCPMCRKSEFKIEKATIESIKQFDFENLPKEAKILILKKLLQTNRHGIIDQSSIGAMISINSLSLANKYLNKFINKVKTIDQLMAFYSNNSYYAAELHLPGAIEWLNNHDKTGNDKLFWVNLGIFMEKVYLNKTYFTLEGDQIHIYNPDGDRAKKIAKTVVLGLLKSGFKIELNDFGAGTIKKLMSNYLFWQ